MNSNLDILLHEYTLEFSVLIHASLSGSGTSGTTCKWPKNVVQSLDEICPTTAFPDSAEIAAHHGTYLVNLSWRGSHSVGPGG